MNTLQFVQALSHFVRRKVVTGLKIPRGALVLDLGSGDKPFWRANVFVDDLSIGDIERAGHLAPVVLGPLVDAQAESLPFEDDTFDFVYCSHLIEHVQDPAKVISEILRVTKPSGGGYIECPNAIVEALAPFPGHRWLVFEDSHGGLHFVRQTTAQHDAALRNRAFAQRVLGKFTWNGYDMFIQKTYTKRDGIRHTVFCPSDDAINYEGSDLDAEIGGAAGPSRYEPAVRFLRRCFRVEVTSPALEDIVRRLLIRGFSRAGGAGNLAAGESIFSRRGTAEAEEPSSVPSR